MSVQMYICCPEPKLEVVLSPWAPSCTTTTRGWTSICPGCAAGGSQQPIPPAHRSPSKGWPFPPVYLLLPQLSTTCRLAQVPSIPSSCLLKKTEGPSHGTSIHCRQQSDPRRSPHLAASAPQLTVWALRRPHKKPV